MPPKKRSAKSSSSSSCTDNNNNKAKKLKSSAILASTTETDKSNTNNNEIVDLSKCNHNNNIIIVYLNHIDFSFVNIFFLKKNQIKKDKLVKCAPHHAPTQRCDIYVTRKSSFAAQLKRGLNLLTAV